MVSVRPTGTARSHIEKTRIRPSGSTLPSPVCLTPLSRGDGLFGADEGSQTRCEVRCRRCRQLRATNIARDVCNPGYERLVG